MGLFDQVDGLTPVGSRTNQFDAVDRVEHGSQERPRLRCVVRDNKPNRGI